MLHRYLACLLHLLMGNLMLLQHRLVLLCHRLVLRHYLMLLVQRLVCGRLMVYLMMLTVHNSPPI